ncbi:MAG: DUF3604 domain-containing protein [Gemmataceae bacterium]|nr:DUF3604 domain-containing protein [Gemmataceae bacterium]
MSRPTRLLALLGSTVVLASVALVWWLAPRPMATATTTSQDVPQPKPEFQPPRNYSPYADRRYPTRVYWGDQHLHTSFSPDAGLVGDRHGPDDAYRFARGEQLRSSTGQLVQLNRPYDWLVVSDHAEYLGLPQAFVEGNPDILKTASGKKWAEALKKGGKAGYEAFVQMTAEFATAKPSIPREAQVKLARTIWDRAVEAAERNNKPGKFTAFTGFEWTRSPKGNNLHRIVVFRDGPDRTKQVLPFSGFDGTNVEDLWKYLADYEAKTGGRVMAIPHNSNLSCGQMFAPRTEAGKPFDKKYAALRARFERLAEVNQSKGDSETTPLLSPNDEFADFERWNKGNIFGLVATRPEMLPFNYVRSALKLGLEHEAKLGVNPFKVGFIGGSDSHTSLSTTRAENYFGVGTIDEPKAERWKEFFLRSPVSPKLDTYMWEMAPGGLGGVWARENTREAIWDAMERREVYCTTGTRPTVRVFGGWGFQAKDLQKPDPLWVEQGYARGVPMGGDLTNPPKGKTPTFMVKALYDPDGAYLDRIQIIKGWIDGKGKTHEKVIDVAWSGNRQRNPKTGKVPLVGSTVDVKKATWTNSIGAPVLTAYWQDEEFDPQLPAFYYVRVIEIPTPRWTAYDAARFGVQMPAYVPMTVTNRAYTSPIWYSPK